MMKSRRIILSEQYPELRKSTKNSGKSMTSFAIMMFIAVPLTIYLPGGVSGAQFLEPIKNVTVTVGRDAALYCSVADLGNHSVGWIHLKRQMIVAVHSRMITRINRYSVTHDSHSTWTLRINGVTEEDRGYYMCQINTDPALSQVGYLQVVVPPLIVDMMSSPSEIQIAEKKNVTLRCRAKGFPTPGIKWKKEDGSKIFARNKPPELVHVGEVLELEQVSRTHMGAYLCIASNAVPPSVSKRIIMKVKFPPQIHVPNQLVGVPTGDNVTIECHVEAYPKAISYWVKGGNMIMNNLKYSIRVKESVYRIHMMLTIVNFQKENNATYKCVAKNSLGESEGDIRLNEIYLPPKSTGFQIGGEARNQEIVVIPGITPTKYTVNSETETGVVQLPPKGAEENNGVGSDIFSKTHFPIDQGFIADMSSGKDSIASSFRFVLFVSLCLLLEILYLYDDF